jgi:hypothetical protein
MINDLVCKVFATRGFVHLAHWKTKSYAEHVALGDLYEDLVAGIDKLVEAYQGIFGLLKDVTMDCPDVPDDIVKYISDELIWINNNSEGITKNLPALDNILQELQGFYLKALYKLKNLS